MAKHKKTTTPNDIELVFKNVYMIYDLDSSVYTEDDGMKIRNILAEITQEIHIDKTYVAFKDTKFTKTFLTETGWNALCNLIIESDYCKNVTKIESETLREAYIQMIIEYVNQVFADLGYDISSMMFDVKDGTKFIVEYHNNASSEWKTYCGNWQTWGK